VAAAPAAHTHQQQHQLQSLSRQQQVVIAAV
jgi:hypothetical protein